MVIIISVISFYILTVTAYKAMVLLRLHSDTAVRTPAYPMPINP
jgi:hypothetical protein